MKRNAAVAAGFVIVTAALGHRLARARSPRGGAGRRRRRAGAALRGRSAVAQAAAEPLDPRPDDRRVGRCAGSRLDHSSRRLARARRGARDDHPADGAVLRAGAAGPRVRRGRQPDRPLGRARPGLRLARLESRHHRRLQRQRLDRRQRPRRAAGAAAAAAAASRPPDRTGSRTRARRRARSRSTTTWS